VKFQKFDEWFNMQVGRRPSSASTPSLIQNARGLEEQAKNIRDLINQVNEWEARRSIARVAWLAAGGKE
jgi:hypothetical protein